jgi:hypothetical protein
MRRYADFKESGMLLTGVRGGGLLLQGMKHKLEEKEMGKFKF